METYNNPSDDGHEDEILDKYGDYENDSRESREYELPRKNNNNKSKEYDVPNDDTTEDNIK